jgi:hypothetical protein
VPTTRYGALDLGGASTQITFASTASIMADAYSARVGDAPPDRVYSHSYMRAGVDQVRVPSALLPVRKNSHLEGTGKSYTEKGQSSE